MREIDAHSMRVLEFPRVRDLIAREALSPAGKTNIENLRPLPDRAAIELSLRRSSQMRDIIRFEEAIPLDQIDDIREAVATARIDGSRLDPKRLLQIRAFLHIITELAAYGKDPDRKTKFPDIIEIILRLHPKREIVAAIDKAIDPSGDVLDRASSALGRIRREIDDAEAHLKQHLAKILSTRRKHAGWQDDVITLRDGRYVIPVLSGEFNHHEGIVHDKSHSGATLFVEPSSAIPINNKLRQLQQDERLEIDRILRELTAMIGESTDAVSADIETFGLLDAVHACALFALKTGGRSPAIVAASELRLIDARHPLLMYTAASVETVIPMTIVLNRETQGVLVTGPNTGGKTVALKTVGLLILMAMSGLEIPADEKSVVGLYSKVYADIGDEQSIELSLSTFSSHIRNIIAAVRDADDRSLILFDEIGAGTDPKEGAALAEAIIIYLLNRGSNLVATTHYSQLKTMPLEHPELVNASLEFDRETLAPTFRLQIGHPGSSYAIQIARRLGLPGELAEQAATLVGSQERSLDTLIDKLDQDLKHLREERTNLQEALARAKTLEESLEQRQDRFNQQEKENTRQFVEQYERQLRDGKKELEELIREVRASQADAKKVRDSRRVVEHQVEQIATFRKSLQPERPPDGRVLQKGDRVWIEKFGSEGEVVQMIGKKKVKIAIGSAFMTVDTIDVTRREEKTSPETSRAKKAGAVRADAAAGEFRPEIMLRGMTVDEAIEKLDKFLDDAVVAGVGQIYIIHGKGTGALRKSLSLYLKGHPSIESIRIGEWNEGGHGVTIARLRP